MDTRGTRYVLEVTPAIPKPLARLADLANDLWYSWDRPTREVFARLHPGLWNAVGHSPKAFLARIDQSRLDAAAKDPVFLYKFHRIVSAHDTYEDIATPAGVGIALDPGDHVAYFCAEFGFHESLPIYSGGLGILAADHCKAASDSKVPLTGVGLLYRQGYFSQTIDAEGNQHANYADSNFAELPVELVRDDDGHELRVAVDLPGREVSVRLWRARAGHVALYLLDTDVAENAERDRLITYRLYGGDRTTRIEQEIVLGIGGVRALAALGVEPTVWHMNEGHAAFMVLERVRMLVRRGLPFETALEAVAANNVFTTHTPVAAGHDQFATRVIDDYFARYCGDVDVPMAKLFELGRSAGSDDFNMTALAVRGSRMYNGVSRIHGEVTSRTLQSLWPDIPPDENPVDYVTNGVHVRTFLALEWFDLFDRYLGAEWAHRLASSDAWHDIDRIPDHLFWSVHQHLKSSMLEVVCDRICAQHFRNQGSESHLDRILRFARPGDPSVLTVGFARRFATYKRATLLFSDLEWLRAITSDPKRPIVFIFAGRAHPADVPGQDLIRDVARVARMPEFEGKILLVEGYDLRLGRRLVAGVDVWLNNPIHPLEASGTSGMKAGMNGVINLSVQDGWWGEGYRHGNGWAIKPASGVADPARRDGDEARSLYEILQDHTLPMYYDRSPAGYSPAWVRMAKQSMATILPRFNARRMLGEYVDKLYTRAARQGKRYVAGNAAVASAVAAFKRRVREAWPRVALRMLDKGAQQIAFGERFAIEVAVELAGLDPRDIVVEVLLERIDERTGRGERRQYPLAPIDGRTDGGEHRFRIELAPELCGHLTYRLRAYPYHPDLTHPHETGLMRWA
ncbi:MAG TPA: alpha-glucan family phosphorylase [Casimicrobiaceae bacterium]|nr:alpha-glucan family phosphorylase [Casimicrobiaceae bacterium]